MNLPAKSTFPAVKDLLHTCAFDVLFNPISTADKMITVEKLISSHLSFIVEFNFRYSENKKEVTDSPPFIILPWNFIFIYSSILSAFSFETVKLLSNLNAFMKEAFAPFLSPCSSKKSP